MPRRKKPTSDMTDREAWESLFPKKIRERVEREVELDIDPQEHENTEEIEDRASIKKKDN